MKTYPVKAVSRLTGLTPETLRAWERRYQAVTPARDSGGRRTYSAGDVERLRELKLLVNAGHAISRVVAMDERDRRRLIDEVGPGSAGGDELAVVREELLASVKAYDAVSLERRLGLVMATLDADRVAREILGPLLESVGLAWHRGDMDIAQERLVSSVIKSRILATLASTPDFRPALMLATPPGERHELGLLLFAFRAASRLIPLRYLGADLPLTEVRRLARRFGPRIIGLSLVCEPKDDLMGDLDTLAGDGFEIWLGGRGAESLGRDLPAACRILHSAEASSLALDGLGPPG